MIHIGLPGGRCVRCNVKIDLATRGRECPVIHVLDLDLLIVQTAQKIASGEVSMAETFMVKALGKTHVSWTGVGGTTQVRELGEDRNWDYSTQARDYAKILAPG